MKYSAAIAATGFSQSAALFQLRITVNLLSLLGPKDDRYSSGEQSYLRSMDTWTVKIS